MYMSIPREEKGRVKYLIAGRARHPYSQVYKKLKNQCPTLALIAGNIPGKKISDWEDSDEFYHARFQRFVSVCMAS